MIIAAPGESLKARDRWRRAAVGRRVGDRADRRCQPVGLAVRHAADVPQRASSFPRSSASAASVATIPSALSPTMMTNGSLWMQRLVLDGEQAVYEP